MQRRIFILGCAVVAVTLFGLAVWFFQAEALAKSQEDLNKSLNGDYAYQMTMHCSNGRKSNGDVFTGHPELHLNVRGSTSAFMLQATLHYNGDGTGTIEDGHLLLIIPGATEAGSSPVRMNDYSCTLTYEVNPDGTLTQWLGPCTSTRIAGDEPGDTYSTDGITVHGQIAKGGKTLLLWDTDTNVEDQTRSRSGESDVYYQRICSRGGTAVMIK